MCIYTQRCSHTVLDVFTKNCRAAIPKCAGVLSWCRSQRLLAHNPGHFLAIARCNVLSTSMYYAAVILCLCGTKCFKIIPQQSENVTIMAFVCDSHIHAFFVRGSSGVFPSQLPLCFKIVHKNPTFVAGYRIHPNFLTTP